MSWTDLPEDVLEAEWDRYNSELALELGEMEQEPPSEDDLRRRLAREGRSRRAFRVPRRDLAHLRQHLRHRRPSARRRWDGRTRAGRQRRRVRRASRQRCTRGDPDGGDGAGHRACSDEASVWIGDKDPELGIVSERRELLVVEGLR